jgi:hypothetical protein
MREHLKGCFRGLVANGSTHVPFVTVDEDRHSGDVLSELHIREVMATGRLLTTCFSHAFGFRLSWCVEVNPKNGSTKFFGWGDRLIPIDTAGQLGKQIHDAMGRNGLLGPKKAREVFPFNHRQVLLPMRIDKTTIIDTGILTKCLRKKRISQDYTDRMVNYETYSVIRFCEWLTCGGQLCERTLYETLKTACANLPDRRPRPAEQRSDTQVEDAPPTTEEHSRRGRARHPGGTVADNPNSFERQHEALLVFCRQMGRVVSEAEALRFIREHRLYTGDWQENLARRRSRVRWILKRIAKTFDPAKCRGVRHDVNVGKYDQWARHHIGTIKGRDWRSLDEFGNIAVRKNRYRVDWRFVSAFLSVVEYCLITSPNEDGSLPHVRAEEVWARCYEGGQITVPFCDKKWVICREWLEKRGILKVVDRQWHRGKAMRWEVSQEFYRLPKWWRRQKRPSLSEAVPLGEFLNRRMRGTHSLNTYSLQVKGERKEIGLPELLFVRPPP